MPDDESDPSRLELTFDEARHMQPLLRGKPVCLNHIKDLVVGRVLDSSISPTGEWQVEFELDDDNALVASAIDGRHFYGLSLAHDYETFEPEEVSLCREGARQHARVFVPEPVPSDAGSTVLNASHGLPKPKRRTVLCASLDANRLFQLQPPSSTASAPSNISNNHNSNNSNSSPSAAKSAPMSTAAPSSHPAQAAVQASGAAGNSAAAHSTSSGPQDDVEVNHFDHAAAGATGGDHAAKTSDELSEHVNDELAKRQTFESLAKLSALKGLSVADKERIKAHMSEMLAQFTRAQKEIAEHREMLAKREAELKEREAELETERQGRQLDQRTQMEVFKRLPGLNLDPQEELDLERDLAPVCAKSQPLRKVIECCRKIGDRAAFQKEFNIQDGISPDDLASAQKLMSMTSHFAPPQQQQAFAHLMQQQPPQRSVINASALSNKRNYATMSSASHSAYNQHQQPQANVHTFDGALDPEIAQLFASTPAGSTVTSSNNYSRNAKRGALASDARLGSI